MEIEIDSKRNNPLLNRTEVHFTVNHKGEGTPNREIIRSELAEKLNVKKENVIVNSIDSGFGIQTSTGYAKVYKSTETAKNWERKHILIRNKLIQKEGTKKEEKPAEPKEEKPTEKQPPSEKSEEKPVVEETPKEGEKQPVSEESPQEPVEKPLEEPAKEDVDVSDKSEEKPESAAEEKPAEEKKE